MNPLRFGLRPFWLFLCVFILFSGVDSASAQGLLITEFQAFNESTLQDEDSEYSDWIEIFNSGDAAVNLNGYYLTDSVEDWLSGSFQRSPSGPEGFWSSSLRERIAGAPVPSCIRISVSSATAGKSSS